MIRFIILVALLLASACGGVPIDSPSAKTEPVCLASTYEAGGDRSVCGADGNPVVLECDSAPTESSIAHYVGARFSCYPGSAPNTMCCELAQ